MVSERDGGLDTSAIDLLAVAEYSPPTGEGKMEKLVDVLNMVVRYLDKVPSNFWGIILGALFTILGIHLTNRANDSRLQQQLEHDRNLKNREREMSLRKDIYLAATEAISAGLISIGRFSDLELSHDRLTNEYQSKSSSISKVHLVAKEATVKILLHFSGELAATLLRLSAKRGPLLGKMNQIATLRGLVDIFTKEQSRTLELMKQHNLEGSTDQRKFNALQTNFDFETRRIEENSKKMNDLAATLYSEQLQFMEECVEETMRLWRLSVPVVASARKELDLPIDESEYGKLVEEAIYQQRESIKEFRKQIQAHLPTPPST